MTRILSLDDEPGMLELYGLILGRAGYEYLCTSDDFEAWAILRSEPVDLFTQDLMRPIMDGWEFYQEMRADETLCGLPILVITARAKSIDISAYGDISQVDGYLCKPFGPNDLLATLQDVLTRRGRRLPTAEEQLRGQERFQQWHGGGQFWVGTSPTGEAQTVEALIQALNGEDWKSRWEAAFALGRSKDAQAVGPLVAALHDNNSIVRMMAAHALGEIGDKQAVRPLTRVLSDADSWVRRAAAYALRQVTPPEAKGLSLIHRFIQWVRSLFRRK